MLAKITMERSKKTKRTKNLINIFKHRVALIMIKLNGFKILPIKDFEFA